MKINTVTRTKLGVYNQHYWFIEHCNFKLSSVNFGFNIINLMYVHWIEGYFYIFLYLDIIKCVLLSRPDLRVDTWQPLCVFKWNQFFRIQLKTRKASKYHSTFEEQEPKTHLWAWFLIFLTLENLPKIQQNSI